MLDIFKDSIVAMMELEYEFSAVAENPDLTGAQKLCRLTKLVDQMAENVMDSINSDPHSGLPLGEAFLGYLRDEDMLQFYLADLFNEESCDGEKTVCFTKSIFDRHVNKHIKAIEEELYLYDYNDFKP